LAAHCLAMEKIADGLAFPRDSSIMARQLDAEYDAAKKELEAGLRSRYRQAS